MAPSPPGIRITLARGAFGLISTAREPPILTVSSAMAGAHARPASMAAAPKQLVHPYLVISYFHVLTAHRPFSSLCNAAVVETSIAAVLWRKRHRARPRLGLWKGLRIGRRMCGSLSGDARPRSNRAYASLSISWR